MDKDTLLSKREVFFQQIIEHINRPPSKIDIVLNQDKYYILPDMSNTFVNSEYGDMIININGSFFDKNFNVFYSFWQLSDTLKIGIAINDDELQGAFASDSHNEVYSIWGSKNDPTIDIARGRVFYDWEFDVPHLYDSYKQQERFILGVKHMHFRVMRIIHDECQRIFFGSELTSNTRDVADDDMELISEIINENVNQDKELLKAIKDVDFNMPKDNN
ncbi:hypothetical protein GW796_07270 [archaeon]|nr:hypothetical protein [archaeon]NCQ51683.1 hypothetical protein [archaeon]